MFDILKKFFLFYDKRERREFYISIVLGVVAALFSALKIPAIAVILQAVLNGSVTTEAIFTSLGIMLVSVIGSSLLKYRATALQTDGGYSTTANKRVQIAEHLRYLPMGYFRKRHIPRRKLFENKTSIICVGCRDNDIPVSIILNSCVGNDFFGNSISAITRNFHNSYGCCRDCYI